MKLDKPIGLLFDKKPDFRTFQTDPMLPMSDKYIGVEIEAENIKYRNDSIYNKLFYWSVTSDGSLRNYGTEFISQKLRGMDILHALRELEVFFETYKISPVYSERTSVHIHIDSRYLNTYQLKTLMCYYLACEPYFFSIIGKGRENNIYCVPYYKNVQGINNISQLFSKRLNDETIYYVIQKGLKYEAMNIRSIQEKGSIEFRHHYGTHDKTTLYGWIINLLNLFKLSKESSEDEFNFLYNSLSYKDFLLNCLPKFTDIEEEELIRCKNKADSVFLSLKLYSARQKDFVAEVRSHFPKPPKGDF